MSYLDDSLFSDIVVLFLAAFGGGLIARSLRLPMLLGYLAVGMVVGPHGFGLVGNVETVQTLAEFGVILLLFAVGVEISIQNLVRLGRVVVFVGLAQVVSTAAIGYGVGLLLGWSGAQAAALGLVVSMSSTMVVLKALIDRGELQSLHGRLLTGLLLMQDLAFVAMVAVLPALGDDGLFSPSELGLGLLKAAGVLIPVVLLGGRLIPWLLRYSGVLGSREAFIVAVVAITFATAALTRSIGLSAALGAFVAGLALSESDFSHRALGEVVPLRNTFAALFFVSLGMLTDPGYLVDHADVIVAVVALVVVVKFTVTALLLWSVGFLPHTALLTGVGMVQVGEFSFILAGVATTQGIVDDEFLPLTVTVAVVTMAITPWALAGGAWAAARLSMRTRAFRPYLPGRGRAVRAADRRPRLQGHVVLAGLGRVGSLVAQELSSQGIPIVVIDMDPRRVERSLRAGLYAIHGDSGNPTVLEAAMVGQAKMLAISLNDPVETLLTAQHALRMNPSLDVVARVGWREEGERLIALGVAEVVWPEMEGGLEILRHTMLRTGNDDQAVESLLDTLRRNLAFAAAEDDGEGDNDLPP